MNHTLITMNDLIARAAWQLVRIPKDDEQARQIIKDEISTYAGILVQIAIMQADKEFQNESY